MGSGLQRSCPFPFRLDPGSQCMCPRPRHSSQRWRSCPNPPRLGSDLGTYTQVPSPLRLGSRSWRTPGLVKAKLEILAPALMSIEVGPGTSVPKLRSLTPLLRSIETGIGTLRAVPSFVALRSGSIEIGIGTLEAVLWFAVLRSGSIETRPKTHGACTRFLSCFCTSH